MPKPPALTLETEEIVDAIAERVAERVIAALDAREAAHAVAVAEAIMNAPIQPTWLEVEAQRGGRPLSVVDFQKAIAATNADLGIVATTTAPDDSSWGDKIAKPQRR